MINMKKILFTFAILLSAAVFAQNKPAQATEPSPEVCLQSESETKTSACMNESNKPQTNPEIMKEVQAYLKECGAFFIATVDGDQPHVRAFGVTEIINDRLYIMTGKVKDVYKQMAKNGKFEICALKKSGSEWIRITGVLVNDESLEVKKEFLERNPMLKSMYKADDENMAVLYITNGTARFCSFSAPERIVNF